ncbi:MAG: GntR family transcriptional regulator [Clostridiales bacterium]|nr:GntR family transcriptional regulator [Clostridiales bacterium]
METGKTSVYLKIVDDIKRRVSLGILVRDERLPSCREYALELGINPNTVQRAYSTLEEEGVIYTIPKKGVYVSGGEKGNVIKVAEEKISELKAAGLSREQLEEIIEEVYGRK